MKDVQGNQIATHIVVPEGAVARKMEQTASRDHDVTLDAGTYPIKWEASTDYRDGSQYATHGWAFVPATAHDHWASTVEFGGVALAGEQRGGERETYTINVYSYQANGQSEYARYGLVYETPSVNDEIEAGLARNRSEVDGIFDEDAMNDRSAY